MWRDKLSGETFRLTTPFYTKYRGVYGYLSETYGQVYWFYEHDGVECDNVTNLFEKVTDAPVKVKEDDKCVRGYHRASKAWYANALDTRKVEVLFGIYYTDGGCIGEMTMEWVEVEGKLSPRLRCFDDSWGVLALFTDLISKMGEMNDRDIDEPEFCKLLDSCGFKDLTEYVRETDIESHFGVSKNGTYVGLGIFVLLFIVITINIFVR